MFSALFGHFFDYINGGAGSDAVGSSLYHG
jgi:hypothetical protein